MQTSIRMRLAALAAVCVTFAGATLVAAPTAGAAIDICDHSSQNVSARAGSSDYRMVPTDQAQNLSESSLNCFLWYRSSSVIQTPGVRALQWTLKYCYGRNISIDGYYGPNTRDAVRYAQDYENNRLGGPVLTEDGEYGPQTYYYMLWSIRDSDSDAHSRCARGTGF